jgi:perosamine synthetase
VYQFIENIRSDKTFFFYRGRIGLYAVLKAMDIEPGDEIILPGFTCFHVPRPIVRLGGAPVYVDIELTTFNIDPEKIEEKITHKTRAILVQHTFGIPAQMDRILPIARKYNLRVIEDCCHALGSRYNGQEVGTFGDAAFYSFGWHKPLVLGVGGAAVVNDPTLRLKVRELYDSFVVPPWTEFILLYLQYFAYTTFTRPSWFWFIRDIYRKMVLQGLIAGSVRPPKAPAGSDGRAGTNDSAYKKRMFPLEEKRLFRRLAGWEAVTAHQKWVVSQYIKVAAQTGYRPVTLDSRFEPVYYKYPLLSEHKTEIFEKAQQAHVELSDMFVSPLYPAWHKKIWETLGYRAGTCPISENVSDRIIPLSVYSKIRKEDIEKTKSLLASFQTINTASGERE